MATVLSRGPGSAYDQEVANVPVIHSGTSEGTGADQEISHGFTDGPLRLKFVAVASGAVISGVTLSDTHFHVTVTSGKAFSWIVESW